MLIGASCFVWIKSNKGRHATSVFPEPVGAMMRTFFPSSMLGIPIFCGSVGSLKPLCFSKCFNFSENNWNAIISPLYFLFCRYTCHQEDKPLRSSCPCSLLSCPETHPCHLQQL